MSRAPFELAGNKVPAGSRASIDIPLAGMYTHTPINMPVQVVHGRRDGPVLFVSAAVHGDEINGVEIIRRLLRAPQLKNLRGTLITVPLVNVFGFHNRERYLPDRRDLNRSFPGTEFGSLAGRLAFNFFGGVVRHADAGIDLHTAAIHRDNLPQIRADLKNETLNKLARAFGGPVLVHSAAPDGSLRGAAAAAGVPVMVYEAGEALRFDELSIRVGLRGIINVMRQFGMLASSKRTPKPAAVLRSSTWVRAGQSGILRALVKPGAPVTTDTVLGLISDPLGDAETELRSPVDGVVIGRANLPLVYEGEALFHIGRTRRAESVEAEVGAVQADIEIEAPELIEEPLIV